jgi:hypothetical protein
MIAGLLDCCRVCDAEVAQKAVSSNTFRSAKHALNTDRSPTFHRCSGNATDSSDKAVQMILVVDKASGWFVAQDEELSADLMGCCTRPSFPLLFLPHNILPPSKP